MGSLPNSPKNKPQLSVVIPAFNEEGNLTKVCGELFHILSKVEMSWEILIVDDGSKDATWDEIKLLHISDKRVKGVRLSRNFGHQYALFAGLSQAAGKAVISMDADHQHPPQVIPKLVDEWKKGNKIVHTIRFDPEDFSFFKKSASKLFYKVFSFLSGVKIEYGMADFRLLDRQVLDDILKFREDGLFLRGLVHWVGYPSSKVKFESQNRLGGTSKYTLMKMIKFAVTGITSFSIIPLRLGIIAGVISSLISFALMVEALHAKIILKTAVPGWATTVIVLTFMFGMLFILLGLIGEYIGRILIEVRSRPLFLINEQFGFMDTNNDSKLDININKW